MDKNFYSQCRLPRVPQRPINVKKVRQRETTIISAHSFPSLPQLVSVVDEIETAPYHIYNTPNNIAAESYTQSGQLSITLSGSCIFYKNGVFTEVPPGHAFLYHYKDTEARYFLPQDSGEAWHFVWAEFRGGNIVNLIDDITGRYGHVFRLQKNSQLTRDLLSLVPEKRMNICMPPEESSRQAVNFLMSLVREENLTSSTPQTELISRAQEMLAQNSNISCAELAGQLDVSREYLSNTFHKLCGKTIQEFRTEIRMQSAIGMLHSSNLTCKEIALYCGFGSYSSFFRSVYARFGMSPEMLRAQNGAVNS